MINVISGAISRTDNWGYICDNDSRFVDGQISEKNPGYNEMTVLYWSWKNQTADYVGLVHYRRYLAMRKGHNLPNNQGVRLKHVLTEEQAIELLERYDLLLPKKRHYYIQSLKT